MADQLSSDLASLRIERERDPDRRSPLRVVAALAVVAAAATAGGSLAYPYARAQLWKTEVEVVEIAVVSPVQASVTVTSTGYVVPQTVSKVGAKVPGRVARVRVKEGDVVKAGDVLLELEDADQKGAIAAAQSRVGSARARAAASRASIAEVGQQVARERELVLRGATGKAVLDDLVLRQRSLEEAAKAAEADVAAAGSEVEALRVVLQDRTIVAPIAGTVVTRPPEVGELVGPQTLAPVLEIVDFDSLLVETDVPEGRLHRIRPGGPCEVVLDAYPTKRYRGQTFEIGKRINRAKATVPVKVRFVDPMEGVLPEMAARVSFVAEELSAEAMKEPPKKVVPASAIATRGGVKVVFVVDGGKLRRVPVEVGPAFGGGLELHDGPEPGTRVVKSPAPELDTGLKVKEKHADGE